MPHPTGVDLDGALRWLARRADVLGPLTLTPIHGGRSNLTFTLADAAGTRWVLRRPPLHGVLESAHDMGREARIMAALGATDVPVPTVVGFEADPGVVGAPFYIMDFVDGVVLRDRGAAESIPAEQRRAVAHALAKGLAQLHQVDPDAIGLGDLGRRDDYIARQLRRWHGQYAKGKARELTVIDEVHDRLVANIPEQLESGIVHGDYRLDNVIVGDHGDIRAVLDWELCTLGDPMADVGLLDVYWTRPDDPVMPLPDAPTLAAGFPERAELLATYAEASGRDLGDLDYYVAFGRWKLAVILEGVYSRYLAGAYGQDAAAFFEPIGGVVAELAELAAEAAGKAGR